MIRPVPAVIAKTVSMLLHGVAFGIGSTVHPGKSCPVLAMVMTTTDWSTPSAIVK